MACPAPEAFSAFVSGRLAEPARDALELHVDSCASCRVTLSELGRGVVRAVAVEDKLGRYALAGELGAGAMGVVYLARDPELDREVAIKLVHAQPHAPEDELVQQRVLREGRALARIDHPNVVRVFDVGRSNGALFVAMERAPGVSLRAWLATPRSRADIVDVFAQCARGLAAAHAAGIVHRDFKPDNVVVDEHGHARVTDFGLAQTEAEPTAPSTGDADVRVTRTRGVVGTPAYMAPEQHRGEPIDARADQYAWGIAFVEALTGSRPFAAKTVEALLVEMRTPPVVEAPRRVRRVIARALAFEPGARWASMTEVADALRAPRRWWPWALAAGVLAAGVLALAMREPRDACAGVGAGIDRAWNPARVDRIGELFAASGKPFAARAWQYARSGADAYAGAWKTARVGVCRAGVERGEVDAATRARIIACLERRVLDLDGLLARLETAQIDALAAAPSMIDRLAAPTTCTAATGDAAPPALAARYVTARATADAGQIRDAEAQLQALARELAAHPALRAEVLVTLGNVERELGKRDAARESFVAALSAGELARADRARASAYLGLAQSSAEDFARPAEARESIRLADAVLDRLDHPRELVQMRDAIAGLTALQANEPAEALASLRRSIADDVRPTQRAGRMQMLARALIANGDAAAALAELERAEQLLVATLGPDAPQLVFVFNSMMEPLSQLGRHADAIARGQRAIALLDATWGKQHPRRSRILGNLAGIYGTAGDDKRARELEEEVLAIAIANAPGSLEEANSHLNLSQSLDELGEPAAAITHLERAKEIYVKLLGPEAPLLANVYGGLADAHAKLGRPAEALAATERALAIREATDTPPGYLAYARFHLALALDAAGQRARAVAMARRALELPLAATGREADLAKQIRSWLATHR